MATADTMKKENKLWTRCLNIYPSSGSCTLTAVRYGTLPRRFVFRGHMGEAVLELLYLSYCTEQMNQRVNAGSQCAHWTRRDRSTKGQNYNLCCLMRAPFHSKWSWLGKLLFMLKINSGSQGLGKASPTCHLCQIYKREESTDLSRVLCMF